MTFDSSKPLKKAGNIPVPQYWNDDIEDWEVVKGSSGAYRMQAPTKLAKEPFSASANLTKEFASEMTGFVISNDGNADLTFTIDGDTYTVKAGEVFEAEFAPFTTVTIASTIAYRAYGKVTVGGIVVAPPTQEPDITAPDNVTNLVTSSITQNSLTLTWTASASNDCVGYDVYRGSTLLGSVTGTNYNVTGLTQSTQYTFTVKAKDAANNIASGASVTATTSAQPADTTPPADVAGLASSNLTATGVTLTWTASVASDIKDYNVYNGSTLIATVTGVTYNVTGLTASTAYTFTVKARDTANNEATGVQVGVTTSAPADTTAPTVTASPAAGTFTSTQSVTLSANEGGTTIYYTTDGSTPTTSSAQYSSAIAINATTTLKYFGKDAANNSSAVQTATYTINLADTTAPNLVTGLTAGTPTSSTVPLTWTLSSSGDVTTQEVAYSTDGTNFTVASAVVNAASNSYTVTGLTASTAYTFRVVAVDGAGNRSTAVTTTATTSAAEVYNPTTLLFGDTFTRADADVPGSTETGSGAWTEMSPGSPAAVWGIRSNKLQHVTKGLNGDSNITINSGVADCAIEVTIVTKTSGATAATLLLRRLASNNFYILQDNAFFFYNGGFTAVSPTTGAHPRFVTGSKVKVVMKGSDYTVFVNDVQTTTYSHSGNTTGVVHGMRSNTIGNEFDDFKILV